MQTDGSSEYLFRIVEFAYNFRRSELYIYDGKQIASLELEKRYNGVFHLDYLRSWRILVVRDLPGVMSLVYDVNTDLLYWIDEVKGSLEVSSTATSGLNHRAVLRRDLVKPISLALCAEIRTWFVGLRSDPNQVNHSQSPFFYIFDLT